MKIALCVKKDIHGLTAVRELIPFIRNHNIKIFCSAKTRPAEEVVPELRELKEFERDLPITLCSNQHRYKDYLCDPERWHVIHEHNLNGGEEAILKFQPDLVISMRFSLIFREKFFKQIPGGIINVHSGALPNYRGLLAPFWQMYNGEDKVGCTLHHVNSGIDTGDIIDIKYTNIVPYRSLLWHTNKIYRMAVPLIVRYIESYSERRTLRAIPQNNGNYYSLPTSDDFKQFFDRGYTLSNHVDFTECLIAAGLHPRTDLDLMSLRDKYETLRTGDPELALDSGKKSPRNTLPPTVLKEFPSGGILHVPDQHLWDNC